MSTSTRYLTMHEASLIGSSEASDGKRAAQKWLQGATGALWPVEMGREAMEGYRVWPHVRVVNDALVRLARRDIRRLMIWMPPQHGKSHLVSHLFPAWYLGRNPSHNIIQIGYGHQFAKQWGRKSRDLLAKCASRFGVRIRRDLKAADRWEIEEHGGGLLAAGVGTGISGNRADLIIVDDPVKSAEEALSETSRSHVWDWWTSSAKTRLRSDGLVVIVQTRWHEDDLSGKILAEERDQWEVISMPALATGPEDPIGRQVGEALCPDQYDRGYLEAMRLSMPEYWWECLYQQNTVKHGFILWGSELFSDEALWFDDWPEELALRVVSLDPSKGTGTKASDYAAFTLLGLDREGVLWVESRMDNGWGADRLVEVCGDVVQEFRPYAVTVESNAFQDLLRPLFLDEFRRRSLVQTMPRAIMNTVKKELRIERLDEFFQSGMVRFRRTAGTRLLVDQLKQFPLGRHDDGPDSLEMAVRTASELVGIERETVGGRL